MEQPQPIDLSKPEPRLYISMLGNYAETDETRVLLTPEACGMLTSAGIDVVMESGAGIDISFPDEAYTEYDVRIVSREEALKRDIVLSYSPLKSDDIRKMKPGSTLLCMMQKPLFDREIVQTLLDCNITVGCFDNMISHNNEPVFANIIDEINGRAAIMYAEEYMSFLGGGKGVLLAGVAGINPCEVLIIGEGNTVHAAARAAAAVGADVTIMNNDISALQTARQICGPAVKTLAIHPRVLFQKVQGADVILMGQCTREFELPKQLGIAIKEGAYMLNFSETEPSLTVPRTVSMALSNVMVNFFMELEMKGGIINLIATTPGVQQGIVTIKGKLVDKLIGTYAGLPAIDIAMLISPSN